MKMPLANATRLFAAIAILFSASVRSEEPLYIMTEDWPPLNFVENGVLKGPAVDIVKEIQALTRSKDPIYTLPFSRALKIASSKKNSVLFSVNRNKSRENNFKWLGPIAVKEYAFFKNRLSELQIFSLEDARLYTIGVQRSAATAEFLAAENFPEISRVKKPKQALSMLMANRIDLWYDTTATVTETINKTDEFEQDNVRIALKLEERFLYIVFNRKTSDKIISDWQGALDHLYKNGTIRNIFQHHKMIPMYHDKRQ